MRKGWVPVVVVLGLLGWANLYPQGIVGGNGSNSGGGDPNTSVAFEIADFSGTTLTITAAEHGCGDANYSAWLIRDSDNQQIGDGPIRDLDDFDAHFEAEAFDGRAVFDCGQGPVGPAGATGPAGASDAASVTVTPAGAIASTDAQAALEELDTEKLAASALSSGAAGDVTCHTGTNTVGPCATGTFTHNAGTATLANATSSRFIVKAGSAQATNVFDVQNNAGNPFFSITSAGNFVFGGAASPVFSGATFIIDPTVYFGNTTLGTSRVRVGSGVSIGNTFQYLFSSTGAANGADDAGITRQGAGNIVATDGSTGTASWGLRASQNVASAATTALPAGNLYHITGTTSITTLNTCSSTTEREITLIFDDVLTFTDGNNLKLAGDFVTTADDVIHLVCDGTNWYEISRSVN